MRKHPLTMRSVLNETVAEFLPVTEGRREEDEKNWLAHHPGFEFGVYAHGKLVDTFPSIPLARRAARKLAGQGKGIRIRDVKHPDRSYWHEGMELSESVNDDLVATLQREYPQIKRVTDIFQFQVNWQAFAFEVNTAKRIKDTYVSLALGGKQVILPTPQGEELIRVYRQNMRSIKRYVNSKW